MAETTELQAQETEKQEIVEGSAERTRSRPAFVPRVDILETDDAIDLVADLPGVDESTVDITLENRLLTVKGLVEPSWPEGYELAYAEYRVGDFERVFTVSDAIDRDNIEATVRDGVLRLRLPKARPTTTKIAIKAG
jgi:HSP20 family molecular chaperone IbpA